MFSLLSTLLLVVLVQVATGAQSAPGKTLVRRQVKAIKNADSVTQLKLLTNERPVYDDSKEHVLPFVHKDRKLADELDRKLALEIVSDIRSFDVHKQSDAPVKYAVVLATSRKHSELMYLIQSEDSPTGFVLQYRRKFDHHHEKLEIEWDSPESLGSSIEHDYVLDSTAEQEKGRRISSTE